jgi:hypothetical protein
MIKSYNGISRISDYGILNPDPPIGYSEKFEVNKYIRGYCHNSSLPEILT